MRLCRSYREALQRQVRELQGEVRHMYMLCRDSSCRAYRLVISVEPEGKPGLGLSALSAAGHVRPILLEFAVHMTCCLWAYRCIVCIPRATAAYRVAIEVVSL